MVRGFGSETVKAINFLVGDDVAVFHSNDTFLEVIDDGFVVGSDQEGCAKIINAF